MMRFVYYAIVLFSVLTFLFASAVLSDLTEVFADESDQVDEWLDQNELGEYKKLFRDYGISTLSGCGSPEQIDRLPELPAAEEKRLRRAAHVLQQRLILRQWLTTHRLTHAYSKLLSLDVSSIEDVYWLEDSTARHVLDPKDLNTWTAARQSLPTGKEALQTLKADLWSTVVKNSKHQDAWTWGGMLVVSVSVCGLVTLAAMTQPSLAPEAKHSLLQYVTGKYLHPPSCRVEWGWEEPQPVGETMCFTVVCYQRNGQPYPICDTDDLTVSISHSTRKISGVVELGAGGAAGFNTARVQFTVRAAGLYTIAVRIGGAPVCGSPYRKWFAAGDVSARRSPVARAAHALVCGAGHERALHLLPRDQFDNAAPLPDGDAAHFAVDLSPAVEGAVTGVSYDAVNQRVCVALCFPRAGVFRARALYKGQLLMHGEFDCIVLTASDAATVQRNISSKRHNICYEARLVGGEAGSVGGVVGSGGVVAGTKPRRVLCCLTPRQLIIKDYILKFIPKRITSFRLCPSTKLLLLEKGDEEEGGRFVVEDGAQPPLELFSPDRDLIAATFTQLIMANCGGEDTFKNKQEVFYCALRKVHARHPHDKVSIRVSRADLVRSSLKATRHFGVGDWCKNFDVSFQGEQAVDWGGVRREWFSLLCAQLFDAKLGLFAPFGDSPAGLVHPNPHRPPALKLKHFELAGKLFGKCLYESALGGSYRQLVRARLTRSFLAQIIGLRVHYRHFEQDDPELYLSKVKYVLETDLEAPGAPELFFAEEEYRDGRLAATHELAPGGATRRVTNATKRQYLDALATWRLAARVRREVEAFTRGASLLVPEQLLHAFDERELELLACGSGELCVADWRAHALVSGAGRDWERCVGWLWAALGAFSADERARLLQFTTGCARLPAGGFAELQPRFQVTAAATAAAGALPTAHTCFNQLCLPEYESYEHLVRALLLAINEGAEGFGMI